MLYLVLLKDLYKVLNKMILSEQCISITELKKKVNTYVKDLDSPKFIFVNNRPKAVLISIKEYEGLNRVPKRGSGKVLEMSSDRGIDSGVWFGAESSVEKRTKFDSVKSAELKVESEASSRTEFNDYFQSI